MNKLLKNANGFINNKFKKMYIEIENDIIFNIPQEIKINNFDVIYDFSDFIFYQV